MKMVSFVKVIAWAVKLYQGIQQAVMLLKQTNKVMIG